LLNAKAHVEQVLSYEFYNRDRPGVCWPFATLEANQCGSAAPSSGESSLRTSLIYSEASRKENLNKKMQSWGKNHEGTAEVVSLFSETILATDK
jgi:hypothetical protein